MSAVLAHHLEDEDDNDNDDDDKDADVEEDDITMFLMKFLITFHVEIVSFNCNNVPLCFILSPEDLLVK